MQATDGESRFATHCSTQMPGVGRRSFRRRKEENRTQRRSELSRLSGLYARSRQEKWSSHSATAKGERAIVQAGIRHACLRAAYRFA